MEKKDQLLPDFLLTLPLKKMEDVTESKGERGRERESIRGKKRSENGEMI